MKVVKEFFTMMSLIVEKYCNKLAKKRKYGIPKIKFKIINRTNIKFSLFGL